MLARADSCIIIDIISVMFMGVISIIIIIIIIICSSSSSSSSSGSGSGSSSGACLVADAMDGQMAGYAEVRTGDAYVA